VCRRVCVLFSEGRRLSVAGVYDVLFREGRRLSVAGMYDVCCSERVGG